MFAGAGGSFQAEGATARQLVSLPDLFIIVDQSIDGLESLLTKKFPMANFT